MRIDRAIAAAHRRAVKIQSPVFVMFDEDYDEFVMLDEEHYHESPEWDEKDCVYHTGEGYLRGGRST